MTGPTDPGDDWGFPEVDPADTPEPTADAGPASTSLPEPEEQVFDTGSDAWWRQQAAAQRQAAAGEPVVPPVPPPPPAPLPPPDLVEPEVLNTPSPLDEDWLPPDLPEPAPVAEQRAPDPPDWYRDLVEPASAAAAAAPMPEEEPVALEETARTRQPYEGQRVGPGRALAGAALALLGVLLAIGALILFNGNDEPKGAPTVASPPSATPSASATTEPSATPTGVRSTAPAVVVTARPTGTAPVVPVTVLNNSRRTGFASQAASYFERHGWPVRTTGNYRGRIEQTTVYYAPGQEGSARRFAAQFHIPRVLPRSALPGLPSTGMTVVLTRDYTF